MSWPPSWIWSNRKWRHSIRRPRNRKPHPRTKHEVDRMTHCGYIAIWNFPNERSAGRRSSNINILCVHWINVKKYLITLKLSVRTMWWYRSTTINILDCDEPNYSLRIILSHSCKASLYFMKVARITHSKIYSFQIFQDGSRSPSWIWSADPENHTLEPNIKWIGWPVAEMWPFEIVQMRGRSLVGDRYMPSMISRTPLRCYVRKVAREGYEQQKSFG